MIKLELDLKTALRKIAVPFMGKRIPFELFLTVQDLNDLSRLVIASLETEGQELVEYHNIAKEKDQKKLLDFTNDFLETTFLGRQRVVDKVKELLDTKKILLATILKDANNELITENTLASELVFNNFLFDLGHSILAFNDKEGQEILKKPSWLSLFAGILSSLKLKKK